MKLVAKDLIDLTQVKLIFVTLLNLNRRIITYFGLELF